MTYFSKRISESLWKWGLTLISPLQSYYPYICFIQIVKEANRDDFRDQLHLGIIFSLVLFQFYSSYFRYTSSSSPSSKASSTRTANEVKSQDEHNSLEAIQKLSETVSQWDNDRSTNLGLTDNEVVRQRNIFGYNETVKSPAWTQWLQFIWQKLATPQQLVLAAAVFFSYLSQEHLYSLLCTLTLCITFGISFWQSWQAVHIQQSLVPNVTEMQQTVRNSKEKKLLARELLPGDIVRWSQVRTCTKTRSHANPEQHQVISADCRVIKVDNNQNHLRVDQSAITGENVEVKKYVGDMCYQTTGLVEGGAWAVVVGTGWNTFVGRTIQLVGTGLPGQDPPKKRAKTTIQVTEYHLAIRKIGFTLGTIVSLVVAVSAFISGTNELTILTITLLFIAIPFGLGSIETVRSVGATWLAEEKVIVQHSNGVGSTIGALAGLDVLCATKTGTLTTNNLQIRNPWFPTGSADDIILAAYLAYPTETEYADPIDSAIVQALEASSSAKERAEAYTVIEKIPFDVESKMTRARVKSVNGKEETYAKGAPKAILELCNTTSKQVGAKYRDAAADLARRGFRSLGVARKLEDKSWQLIGLLPMFDAPRSDNKLAIQAAEAMGIRVQMMTGDASAIASENAKLLGLSGDIVNVAEASLNKNSSKGINKTAAGYAEVFPEQQKQIVTALQSSGCRVAITGDGIADTPALSVADCGIAVDGATDDGATESAQSVSDVVMLRAGLSSIVKGIQISRQIFHQTSAVMIFYVVQALHQLAVTVFLYLRFGLVMDLRILVACNIVNMATALIFGYIDKTGPIMAKGVRWSSPELRNSAFSFVGLIPSVISLTCVFFISHGGLQAAHDIRPPIALVHLVLSGRIFYFVLHTDGKLTGKLGLALYTALVPLAVTALCCLGLIGARKMTVTEAGLTWAAVLVPLSFSFIQYTYVDARKGKWVAPLEESNVAKREEEEI